MDKTQLSICTWNSRGFSASIPYLRELTLKYDIVLLSEHWLHSNQLNRFESVAPNIAYFARSSKNADAENYGSTRGEGGVAVLWCNTLKGVTPLREIVHDRFCGVRVQVGNDTFLNIFSVYMPARGCKGDLDSTLDELAAVLENTETGSLNIVGGDLNGDVGSLGGGRGKRGPSTEGRKVFRFATNCSLTFANLDSRTTGPVCTHNGPTGSSCIDYIMIPDYLRSKVISCAVLEEEVLNTSDHNPVCISLNAGSVERQSVTVNQASRIRWNKLSDETVKCKYTEPVERDLCTLHKEISAGLDDNLKLDVWVDNVVGILKRHEANLPKQKFKKHIKPYWCSELTLLKQEKVKHFNSWKVAGRPRDRDNPLRIAHLNAKKLFMKRLRKLHRDYENERIEKVVKSAEIDKNHFWQLLKKERKGDKVTISTIRNSDKVVVSEPEKILEVWREHFDKISTPKNSTLYDEEHYNKVTAKVKKWRSSEEEEKFLNEPFNSDEVKKAITKLHSGNVPGHDGITKENLVAAGPLLIVILVLIFNMIIDTELIPQNFRRGIQIPLYKGKNAPPLDTNSYRGITLLSTLNKLFEVLIWQRMEKWWINNRVISQLQGACRKGISCLHTAMLLQESIATSLESHNKVFVAYYDVAKAFDGVWIDGLFYRLHEMGVIGKTWRVLYNNYRDFKCKVRIQNLHSEWYVMECGIHQGGFLSLMKYTAFINSLLTELEDSGFCCTLHQIKTAPLGYADDVASASTSKHNLDRSMKLVYEHSNRWRYQLNAKKCAVLVFGESAKENAKNSKERTYMLGPEKVVEKKIYDHVGLKNCICGDFSERIDEKISKGRKALCASSGIGMKTGGIPLKICTFIYWSIIVPIVTFASELWVMSDCDIDKLDKFHRYAGRKVQRFYNRTPITTSYECLGWMRLENIVYTKKLLFVRTIAMQDKNSIYAKVVISRMRQFNNDIQVHISNKYFSPIFEILRISILYGLYNEVCRMLIGVSIYTKRQWRQIVWDRAWRIEKDSWDFTTVFFNDSMLIKRVMGIPGYCVWWQLSDDEFSYMKRCETMVKIICNVSLLKSDNYLLDNAVFSKKVCERCDDFVLEDAKHVILQCASTNELRVEMFLEIERMPDGIGKHIVDSSEDILATILGKFCNTVSVQHMVEFWKITCTYVDKMYRSCINGRNRIV